MIPVRQKFPSTTTLDLPAILQREFRPAVKPGARIAVGVGSRGISNLSEVVASVITILKSAGAKPFIIPAMGSHGGATPEGQTAVLAKYGVTEASMGVPIHATMEPVVLGETADGVPVHFSRAALDSDGIVVVNRVKPHTDFFGPLGSGIQKMIAVGFGKHAGASAYHAAGSRLGLERVIRTVSRLVIERVPVVAGIALIEDACHATAKIAVLPPDEIEAREEALLAEARRLMPRLPFDRIHLLIIDRIGKNISGAGIDPNVTGRSVHGYTSDLSEQTVSPIIHRIFVRELTPESNGNSVGIGMADFTTTRLVRSIDAGITNTNVLTALSLNSVKIPIAYDTDREAIERALQTVPLLNGTKPRVVRILDTLSLDTVEVSEAFENELPDRSDLEPLGPARPMAFDTAGNLTPIRQACSSRAARDSNGDSAAITPVPLVPSVLSVGQS